MANFKRVFAVVLSIALIVCALPLSGMIAEAKELQVTDTKLVSYVEGSNNEGNVYNPGTLGTGATWTFSGTQDGWRNNFYSYYHNSSEAAVDFTGCTHITMTLENITTTTDGFTAQEAWQYWLGHMYVIIKSNGSWSRFPLPAIEEGETSVTVEVDLAMLSGFTISSVQRIGIKTVPTGTNWRSDGNMNTSIYTNFDSGYTNSSAPVLKFHPCKIYGIQRAITNTTEEKHISNGFYRFWGKGASNFNYADQALTNFGTHDISDYEYLEMDLYVSDVDKLAAETDTSSNQWTSFKVSLGTDSSNYYTFEVPKADLVSGYNHIKVPVADLGSKAYAFSYIYFYQENNAMQYTANGARNYVLGLANVKATREEPEVEPELDHRTGTVVLQEGITFEGVYGRNAITDSWMPGYGSTLCNAPDGGTLNFNLFDYLEFDYYVSNLANFNARVTDIGVEFCRTGKGILPVSYKDQITAKGWNHVAIAIPRSVNDALLKKINQIKFVITLTASNTGSSDTYKISNVAATWDEYYSVPQITNTHTTVDFVKGVQLRMNLTPGQNTYPGTGAFTLSKTLDTSNAEYIEMDIYVSKDMDKTVDFWVSSNRESAANRGKYTIPQLNAGWNHVIIDALNPSSTNGSYSFQGYDFYKPFFEGAFFSSSHPTGGAVAIANISTTRESSSLNNVYKTMDYIPGVLHTMTLNPGQNTYNDSVAGYFRLSKTLDTSNADCIEMDIYVSADTDRTASFWVSSNRESGSPRGRYTIPLLTAGWNHVVLDATKPAATSGSGYSFQGYEFKYPFFEYPFFTSDHPTGGEVTVANLSVTNSQWNYIPDMPESEGMLTVHSGIKVTNTFGTGKNIQVLNLDNSKCTLSDYTDASDYKYLEFDYYIQDLTNYQNRARVFYFNFFDTAIGSGAESYCEFNITSRINAQCTQNGWNHIVIPTNLTKDGGTESIRNRFNALRFQLFTIKENSSIGKDDRVSLANICLTRDPWDAVPEIAESEETTELLSGKLLSGTYGSAAISNGALPGTSDMALSANTNFTQVDYVELDYYVENISNLRSRASSLIFSMLNSGRSASQDTDILPLLSKNGWNHIRIPVRKGENDSLLQQIRYFRLEATLSASDVAAEEHFVLANIVSGTYAEAVPSTFPVTYDTMVLTTGNTYTGTYGTAAVANDYLPGSKSRYKLSESLDFRKYDFVEFDYYVTNLTNLKARATDLTVGLLHYNSGMSQDTDLFQYLTKNGWNHVKVPIRKGEMDNIINAVQTIRFRITMPESSVASSDTYTIADIKLTCKDYSVDTYYFNQSVTVGRNETEMIVTWISDLEQPGAKVVLNKNGVKTEFPAVERYSEALGYYSYAATVTGLQEYTTYNYRIEVGTVVSDYYEFKTRSFGDTFSFVQISDIQLPGNMTKFTCWNITADAISQNFSDMSFIINTGDVSDSSTKLPYYQSYKSPEFLKHYVTGVVPGNHDYTTAEGDDTHYSMNFTSPDTYVAKSGFALNEYDYWYSYNNILFVALNSLSWDVEYHKDFVRSVIEEHGDDFDWIIVTCHYSLFGASYHCKETSTVNQRNALAPLFNELGVDMVISGHDHIYDRAYQINRYNPYMSTENYGTTSDGVLYISCTTGSDLKYNSQEESSIPYSAVVSAETYGFINYEVTKGSITLTFYKSADLSVLDTYTLFKDSDEVEFPEDTMEDKTDILGGAKNITFGTSGNHTVDLSAAPKNVSADRIFETDVYVNEGTLSNFTVKLTDTSGKIASYQFTGLTAGWNHLAARIADFNTASGFNKSQIAGMTFSSVAGSNIVATNCYTADYVDGDANRDGVFDIKDIVRAKKLAAGVTTEGNKLAVSGSDYEINAVDLTALVQNIINTMFK